MSGVPAERSDEPTSAGPGVVGFGAVVVVVVGRGAVVRGARTRAPALGRGRQACCGLGGRMALSGCRRGAPRGGHQQCHQPQRHGEDHPPVGTAPSHSRAQTLGGVGPAANHGHTIRTVTRHASPLRRRGDAGHGHGGRRARGGHVPSGRPARPWSNPGRGGRRGPGARRAASPRDAGRSGCEPAPRGRSRAGTTSRSPHRGRAGRSGPPRSLDRKSWRRRRQRMAERRSSTAYGRSWPDHSCRTSHVVERSSPKNSSPFCHSPPRPHRSFPATVTSPGRRSCTSIRHTKGSVSASRSRTLTTPAASSRWARPVARRMCSTRS